MEGVVIFYLTMDDYGTIFWCYENGLLDTTSCVSVAPIGCIGDFPRVQPVPDRGFLFYGGGIGIAVDVHSLSTCALAGSWIG